MTAIAPLMLTFVLAYCLMFGRRSFESDLFGILAVAASWILWLLWEAAA